jgi:hypothetical protein
MGVLRWPDVPVLSVSVEEPGLESLISNKKIYEVIHHDTISTLSWATRGVAQRDLTWNLS